MTSTKPTGEEIMVKALASQGDLTSAEIASATGLGRSTVARALAALERADVVRRSPGGRDGGRRRPDRWSAGAREERSRARLRPGELDGLVLDFVNSHGKDAPLGVTAVAKALGRSAGAVGNCLARLAAAGPLEQVSERPRRYRSATPPTKGRGARRSRKDKS
jgi:DNA-binding transcriptional ArsR family regulator